MSVADKLLQIDQVKEDLKQAIIDKGVSMDNVPFTDYPEKVLEISGGGGEVDEYFYYSKAYYTITNSSKPFWSSPITLFPDAWEDMKEVDGSEIERESNSTIQYGKLQYPNGETNGVIIPDSVSSIGYRAFYNWSTNTQPLVIPNSVTSIERYAFYNWSTNNKPLVIPNSVTSIGDYAFRNWSTNTQPLVIPNSVTSIGNYAFRNWSSNNQPLVIPISVTSIGNYAFSSWSLVPYIEIHAFTPPTLVNANAFDGQNDAPIYVANFVLSAYKTATNWSALADRIFPFSDK